MSSAPSPSLSSFHSLALDKRLLKGVLSLGHRAPTTIQSMTLVSALAGRDLCVQARTGSGKTLAYALPVVQHVLDAGKGAVVVVPTNELAEQVHGVIRKLVKFMSNVVTSVQVSSDKSVSMNTQAHALKQEPNIIVGTLGRIADHIALQNMLLKKVSLLVLDEADVLLTLSNANDLHNLMNALPKHQTIIVSATLDEEVKLLTNLLHNPEFVSLPDKLNDSLLQYYVSCKEDDKFLLVYSLLKLGSVRGKTLFFVNSIDKSYKLKLFLERFSISSIVLNTELPQNSRNHILEQFHRGYFDHLIATDESIEKQSEIEESDLIVDENVKTYSVARGIDFKFVNAVINFDLPATKNGYTHRVGRTARGASKGIALTLLNLEESAANQWLEDSKEEFNLQVLDVKFADIEGFRYRVQDVLSTISLLQIKEARLKEVKIEILNSEKLKSHFEDHEHEANLLRCDLKSVSKAAKTGLAVLPNYLMPTTSKAVPTLTQGGYSIRAHEKANKKRKSSSRSDPLKTFGHQQFGKKRRVGKN